MSCLHCTDRDKQQRGCKVNGYAASKFKWLFGEQQLDECPKSFLLRDDSPSDFMACWSAFQLREQGILPCRGGALDQAAVASELIDIIASESVRVHNEDIEKQKRESKRCQPKMKLK